MKKQNNRNNNRKRSNWFENQRRMNGDDFLSSKTANDILKDANRIIKDMAYGNINQEDFKYFQDPRLISNVRQTVTNNWNFVYYTTVGLNEAFKVNPAFRTEQMLEVLNIYSNASFEYDLINKALITLEQVINDVSINNKEAMFCDIFGRLAQDSYKYRNGLNYQFLVILNK